MDGRDSLGLFSAKRRDKISLEDLYGFVSSDEEDNPDTPGDN